MSERIAITISDSFGSRFFSVKRSLKTTVLVGVSVFLGGLAASIGFNTFQFSQVDDLRAHNSKLDSEMLRFDSENSNLNQVISKKTHLIENISNALVRIESVSGVDSSDQNLTLEERVDMVAEYYSMKELEYSEIGDRVVQIEGLIGLVDSETATEEDLGTRVQLVSLTASHEKILHDSIPNGFPTKSRVITSKYGSRIHPITKINSFHKGVDLRAKTGQEVRATADGIIRDASFTKLSGNRLVVQHNFGFEARFSHLDSMSVEPGDIVHKGDLIGYSGNTGRSDAPHLHYEIRYFGKSIDPYQFLKWEFGSHEIFTNVRGIKWPSLISLINKQITHQTLQLSQLEPISSVK